MLIINIPHSPAAVLLLDNLIIMFFLSTDLSNCKLISFPDGVFKVLRSVLDNIHIVTLADNELKAISSKFFSAFSQLEGSGYYTAAMLFMDSIFKKSLCWCVLFILHAGHLTNADRRRTDKANPWFTCVLKYLAELDLQGNVLTKLPDAVGEMEHLTCINLANNSFSIFPDKLTEIATLERINLEGNSITGNNDILRKGVVCSYMAWFDLLFDFVPQFYQWRSWLTCQHSSG